MSNNHRSTGRGIGGTALARWVCLAFLAFLAAGSAGSRADSFSDAAAGRALFISNGCSGCHLVPVWLSGSDRAGGVQSLKDLIGNVPSDGTFKTFLINAGDPMATFASSASASDLAQVQAFLLGTRDAIVTPSIGFTQANVNTAQPAQTVTIRNLRFYQITYSTPTLSNTTDYSLGTQSCATGAVPADGGTCTIQVLFDPKTGGSKPATLSFSFTGDSRETPLAPRTGASAVQISGFGVQNPTATITSALPSPVATGTLIHLNGSGSTPNGVALTNYTWTVHRPSAADLVLSGATAAQTFTAGTPGHYAIDFAVSDPYATSATASTAFDVIDNPTAVLAAVAVPTYLAHPITFNGSGSHAYNGDPFTYAWSITTRPPTSTAQLIVASATDAHPTLTPDVAGTWGVTLDVVDQGIHAASTATVSFVVSNPPTPVADAGTYNTALVNSIVALNGSGSHSQIGDALTYQWSVVRHSDHAAVAVTNATSVAASFTPTLADTYDVTLVVADGPSSQTATASIQASNGEISINPIANQTTILGVPVTVSGSASSQVDPSLVYLWSFTGTPTNSTAAFVHPDQATTTFTPDLQGDYFVKLTASDHFGHSASASAKVTVQPPLSASTQSLNFTAAIGSFVTANAIVTDNDGAPLTLQSITFGDAAPEDYALDPSNGCAPGAPIAHAVPCTLVIRFTPTIVGARNASALLNYGGAGSPLKITLLGTASPRPQGTISSTSFSQAFDDTVIGSTNSKTVTLSNSSSGTSAAPVVFSGLVLSGAAASDYQLGGTCSTSTPLAPQATCTLVFTFAPSATGARAASLQIASDASNPLVAIALTGNGLPVPAPVLTLAPAVVDFGQQTVGGAYPPQTATLTNTGTATLSISTITIAGTGFAIVDASACAGTALAIGASCHVSLSFAPPAVQAGATGTLTINSNVAGSPTNLPLMGTGTASAAPVLVWSPAVASLDFGTVQAGTISATQSVTLSNQGPGGATLSFLNAVGADSAAFSIQPGTCSTTQPLFAGSSCRIDIAFAPSAAGARSATLQVVSNGSAPPPLTLTGTAMGSAALALTASTNAMDFGTVQLGTRSPPVALRLSNSGSGTVQVASITADGAFSVQPGSCPAAPFTLQSGAECTIAVTFQPSAAGVATGTLSVHSDAQSQPGDIVLAGKADNAPDLSSGGCSASRGDGLVDPTLWTLAALALVALAYRRRQRRRDARTGAEPRP